MQIYTIGHSNHTPEKFVKLLEDNLIKCIADVRSTPYSRWAPFANRENLEKLLSSRNINYLYLGNLLGGLIAGLNNNNKDDRLQTYDCIREEEYFKKGINKLVEECEKQRVCILCAEENPSSCHRRLLIEVSLEALEIQVRHIRGDGRVQTEEDIWKEEHKIDAQQSQFRL